MLKGLNAKNLATTGIISAIYTALTLILMPISFGAVQFRISEALTILPLIYPQAIVGLTVGCLISNLFGCGVIDVVFGTFATFISAILTYVVGSKIKNDIVKFLVGGFFPVIINALIVPLIFILTGGESGVYFTNVLTVFLGQAVSVYLIGGNLFLVCNKIKKRS
jgi:uncharacterized membrane protein